MKYAAEFDEAERQAVILALAELARSRPGWLDYLGRVAERFQGVTMFAQFRALHNGEEARPVEDPQTNQEWQDAVDAAKGALTLDAARRYGLVEGGPEVDVARCQDILERGRYLKILPRADAVERFVKSVQEAAHR